VHEWGLAGVCEGGKVEVGDTIVIGGGFGTEARFVWETEFLFSSVCLISIPIVLRSYTGFEASPFWAFTCELVVRGTPVFTTSTFINAKETLNSPRNEFFLFLKLYCIFCHGQ